MNENVVKAWVPDEVRTSFFTYPKVLQLGDPRISDLLKRPHVVEEKLDGSQFRFGKVNGKVLTGSHRVRYTEERPPDIAFRAVSDYVDSIQERLPEGVIFYAEMLTHPKQNTITYGAMAKNGLMLFDAWNSGPNQVGDGEWVIPGQQWAAMRDLKTLADILQIDPPNILAEIDGSVPETLDTMERYLASKSYLSVAGIDVIVEGIVVKCYDEKLPVTYQQLPGLFGKYVRASFKEENAIEWRGKKGSPAELAVMRFKTEARWEKAVLHANDEGKLEWSMRDMRVLLDEVQRDIEEEVKPMAMEMWWETAEYSIRKGLQGGLAEFYKRKLLERQTGK